MTGYQVLDEVPSSSDPTKVYQIRRGGDGILYCSSREGKICQGWLSKRNALRRSRQEQLPAACKHLKAYVARTGASYGPQYGLPSFVSSSPPSVVAKSKAKAAPQAPSVPSVPAPKTWREVLLREREAAEARGIATPASALVEFERAVGRFANLDVAELAEVVVQRDAPRALDV